MYCQYMGIRKFEEIRAWQEARKLNRMVYDLTRSGSLRSDFGLRNQLQKASVSAMTNIAEGFDCNSKNEFIRFLGYARRSAVEVQSLLYSARDAGYIRRADFRAHYDQANRVKKLIGAFMRSLRK